VHETCQAPGWTDQAASNAASLRTLAWAPFRRPETGWEIYAPLVAREIATACPPDSSGFAARLAAFERRERLPVDGVLAESDFLRIKGLIQSRRPFLMSTLNAPCPDPPPPRALRASRPGEGYKGSDFRLARRALAAWRRMAAAARAEDPAIAADPDSLTVFSGYRDPAADAARCLAEGNCQGVVRAACSAHRTGRAVDLYVGQAPGYPPDSSADENRLFMSQGPAYRWLVRNADRFGFTNYPFEPWHWEWTGRRRR
jgi:D-alanyl-D-alanine carboxypeptidase